MAKYGFSLMLRERLSKIRYLFLVSLFTLCFTGCGFHLRGMIDAPTWLNNVSIIIQEGHRDLLPLLKNQLNTYHILVNDSPSLATYWLIIESDTIQQNVTSISSSTNSRQYQLIYKVRFKLQSPNGVDILPSRIVSVTRQITTNNNRILGSNEEEAITKKEMRQEAVIQILNRLSRSSPRAH